MMEEHKPGCAAPAKKAELPGPAEQAGHILRQSQPSVKQKGLAIGDTIAAPLQHRAFSWLAVLSTVFPATSVFFVVAKRRTIPWSTQSRCLGREQRPRSQRCRACCTRRQ
ncbi:hypothetical protein BDP81DRAFT_441844 [Colletotrichum phormii]|uniref:Uncharacterized protein n=1 Tax=Colletotrichum phormii TaxID=359342 RepID=A0AAI9ZD36_9PEZI|nr:uncharacterized protein BDP81DRAFT_441844 [Colletotrichum phormii]KAK1622295.1 hypothetical protein BDP81DRAFT_441844 [Colletotrichum phormii]